MTSPTSNTQNEDSNTQNEDFKHSDNLCIYIIVHVFDCDITNGSSLWGSSVWMWSLFEICILLCQWIKNSMIYVYETENSVLRLGFHNSFHIVFLTINLLEYKVFEFA